MEGEIKEMKKIISILATVSMVASMFVVTANAASTPTINLTGTANNKNTDGTVTLTVKYTNSNDTEKAKAIENTIAFDEEYLSYVKATNTAGAQTEKLKSASNKVKCAYLATSEDAYIGSELVLTTIEFKILKDIDKPITFETTESIMRLVADGTNIAYSLGGANAVTANNYTLLPDAKIEVTSSAATVEKGKSVDFEAKASNFEGTNPTEFEWTVEGKTSKDTKVEKVEGNGAKATLTVGKDETASKLTVKATSGAVSGSADVNVVDEKLPLEVKAATFEKGETTITITPGSDYVADTEYTVTVQFFAEDGTASAWVTQSGLKNNATLTVGAQGAAKANVKAVTADGTIIGSMQQVK